jgi:hypothetical protein
MINVVDQRTESSRLAERKAVSADVPNLYRTQLVCIEKLSSLRLLFLLYLTII